MKEPFWSIYNDPAYKVFAFGLTVAGGFLLFRALGRRMFE